MTETQWLMIFGDNLIDLMARAGMSQRDLADEIGVSESTISKYIHKMSVPGVRTLVNMAYALDCSLDELMDFGDRIR